VTGAGWDTWLIAGGFVAAILGIGYGVEWWADRRDRLRDCPCPLCRSAGK
jgi:hypothetical protein